MKKLQLSLIQNWDFLIQKLIKKEDYRIINPYWCNRFLLINGKSKSQKWWYQNFFEGRSIQKTIISLKENATFKTFTQNTMTLGYPKANDKERILIFEHAGIEIREGKPEWGAEPGKVYFVIKHGKRIQ